MSTQQGSRYLIFALAALFFPALAFADLSNFTTDIFQPKPTDASLALLREIIGDWRGTSASMGTVTPLFKEAMTTFNMAVLAFGALIFTYTAVIGTLQSAHDGQLLGKQWSTVWVPVRFSLGVSLLVPTATGLCMAQLGLLWLLSQGVGIASTVWENAVKAYAQSTANLVAIRSSSHQEVRDAMSAMLAAEMCIQRMNETVGADPSNPVFGKTVFYNNQSFFTFPSFRSLVGMPDAKAGGEIRWGGLPGSGYQANACGVIVAPDTTRHAAMEDTGSPINIMGTAQMDALWAASMQLPQGVKQYYAQYNPASSDAPPVALLANALDAAVITYRDHMTNTINEQVSDFESALWTSITKDAERNGWITAGTWVFQIARINKQIGHYAQSIPQVSIPEVLLENEGLSNVLDPEASLFQARLSHSGLPRNVSMEIAATLEAVNREYFDRFRTTRNMIREVDLNLGSTGSATGFAYGGVSKLSQTLFGVDREPAHDSARLWGYDPLNSAPAIIQLKSVGDTIVNTTQIVLAAGAIAAAGGEAIPSLRYMKNMFSPDKKKSLSIPLMTLLTFMVISLFAFGVVLAFWLPMLPFINWVGGVIGWTISTLEMLIAAPVWVAAHLHPDGEGIASRHAASGYMIILELLLRPVLMIFGLIVAIIIADPLLNLISAMFYPALASSESESLSGLVTYIMKIMIFVVLCWMAINFTFKAITSVPTGVMRWIGGMQGSNSEMAEGLGENARTIVVAGAHKMTGAFQMTQARKSAGR